MSSESSANFRIETVAGERGVVTDKSFQKGQLVAKLTQFVEVTEPTWETVRIGENRHIKLLDEFVNMNHSCDPSTFIDVQNLEVRAARDIEAGEQITFFYPCTEFVMARPFVCNCKKDQCIKLVSGRNQLPAEVMERYLWMCNE